MRLARLLAPLLAAGCAALSCPASAEITIGVALPLSGGGAALGVPARTGIPFWPQEIAGEKLKVIVMDDAGDPATATRIARRFAEDKVDLIVGSIITPPAIAVSQVANEARVLNFSAAPLEVPDGKDAWTFRLPMPHSFYMAGIVQHMKQSGVKTVGFLGWSDAYGEINLQALNEQSKEAGIKVTSVERFTRADTSVTAQALRVVATQPEAILVAASGGGAALPQKALKERGYKGRIYHVPAAISPDFIRLAGKDAEGALVLSGPDQVPEQLPESHPARKAALDFVQRYEAAHGAGSRTQFAANLYDVGLVLQKTVPVALKQAKPGTPEFRAALKSAVETMDEVLTPKGELKYSATDHWGRGASARVMLTVNDGKWALLR